MAETPISSTLPNLEAFCRTYETRSFTKAARILSVTPQATSRSIARLEGALGMRLFRRSTRSLAPTEEARRYYEVCVEALSLLSVGERVLATGRRSPEGRVRISVGTTYGHHRLLPSLGAFRERHPKVRVEIHVSNQNIDFVRDGYDLAIRMGTIGDHTMVARKLGDFAVGVYGSSAYLARSGTPRTPDDLAGHQCIGFVMPTSGRVLPWSFHPAPRRFVPDAAYRCADDVLGVLHLARAGLGLIQTYDFLVEDDVARGTLVQVLAPFRGASRPFSIIHPKSAALSDPARALKEFIVERERRVSARA